MNLQRLLVLITATVSLLTCSCVSIRQTVTVAPVPSADDDEPALLSFGPLKVCAGGDDRSEFY